MTWGRRKLGPKSEKNQPLPLFFFFFCRLSLFPLSFSAVPSATTTAVTSDWKTIVSTTLLPPHWYFSLFLHSYSNSPFSFSSLSNIDSYNISADLHLHNLLYHHYFHQRSSSSVVEQPPWPSLSSPSSISLSSATSSSSSHSRLQPPSLQPTPPEPPVEPPHHDQDPRDLLSLLLPAMPLLPRRGCCMHNSFLHAASQLIRPWFGPGQLWLSPNGWVWPDPPIFFLIPIFFKNHKKNHDFLKYFFIHFA